MAYSGTVLSYGGHKGFGFIGGCDQVSGDVFFGRAALPSEFQQVHDAMPLKGKVVNFELKPMEEGGNGKLVATRVTFNAVVGEVIVGTIKSYNPTKGFGFLASSSHEGDFFFSKRDLPPQAAEQQLAGAVVSFTVAQQDGKAQAKQVTVCAGGSVVMGGAVPQAGMGMPGAWGSPRPAVPGRALPTPPAVPQQLLNSAQLWQGQAPMRAPARPMMQMSPMMQMAPRMDGSWMSKEGQRMSGTVHSYNDSKGFGFIKSASIPLDVYFKFQGEHFPQGTQVAFTLKVMGDGKPQAREVCLGLVDGGVYTATVTSYSMRNGYGFLTVPGLGDVYFKKESMPAEARDMELMGMHGHVQVKLTTDRKPQAASVTILSEAPADYVPPTGPSGGAPRRSAPQGPPVTVPALMPQAGQPPLKRPRMEEDLGSSPGNAVEDAQGTVLSFNPRSGFGFIASPNAEADVWFGTKSLTSDLVGQELQGANVVFRLVYTRDGKPQGQNVRLM